MSFLFWDLGQRSANVGHAILEAGRKQIIQIHVKTLKAALECAQAWSQGGKEALSYPGRFCRSCAKTKWVPYLHTGPELLSWRFWTHERKMNFCFLNHILCLCHPKLTNLVFTDASTYSVFARPLAPNSPCGIWPLKPFPPVGSKKNFILICMYL